MVGVGIDVGSDSVRVCVHGGRSSLLPLIRETNGDEVTMKTEHLWGQICSLLDELIPEEDRTDMQAEAAKMAAKRRKCARKHGYKERKWDMELEEYKKKHALEAERNEKERKEKERTENKQDLETQSPGIDLDGREIDEPIASRQSHNKKAKPGLPNIKEFLWFNNSYEPSLIDCPVFFVSATCSMAVMERVTLTLGKQAYRPLEDIIVWMDCRAREQAKQLTETMPPDALRQVGDRVTPEMGIAKLKWVDEKYKNSGKDVVVFELYDWVTYLLAAGGLKHGLVECLSNDITKYRSGSRAMDGSVKGWGQDVMKKLHITAKVGHVPSVMHLNFQLLWLRNKEMRYLPAKDKERVKQDRMVIWKDDGKFVVSRTHLCSRERDIPGCVDSDSDSQMLLGWQDWDEDEGFSRKRTKREKLEENCTLFHYAGEPIAPSKVIGGTVLHGCIDCYAGLVADEVAVLRNELQDEPHLYHEYGSDEFQESGSESNTPPPIPVPFQHDPRLRDAVLFEDDHDAPSYAFGSVEMVAGTLTCFLARSNMESPIEGIWGPYDQLVYDSVYAFGQPATGKLFAELLESTGETFESLEEKATQIEKDHKQSLTVLARHHLYTGDRYGNRSPFGEFSMSDVYVSGANASKASKIGVFEDDNNPVLRYYLIMEFLAFQTKQLISDMPNIRVFRVCGSQANNKRFMRLLQQFSLPDPERTKFKIKQDATFSGASAAAFIASGDLIEISTLNGKKFQSKQLNADERWVLKEKYEAFQQLATWQADFRERMSRFDQKDRNADAKRLREGCLLIYRSKKNRFAR